MAKFTGALAIGTVLQILMVLIGHFAPAAQQAGLFPIAGTVIGALTGWLAAAGAASAAAAAGSTLAGALAAPLRRGLGQVPR
jgi:hypothetical protein